MTTTRRLTDRKALDRQRRRAIRHGDDAMFLQKAAAAEVQERLGMVNKRFTDIVLITPFAGIWAPFFPTARIIGDDERLDLAAESADLIIHALCLHWADDPLGQLIQCRRALRPDSLFLGVLFGGRTLADLRESLAIAEAELRGGLAPRVLPMAEIRDLGALLQRAGLALPVADSAMQQVSYRDILALMRDLRHMGEGNALADRARLPLTRAMIAHAGAALAARAGDHGPGQGLLTGFEFIHLSGWSPGPDQPQPLRPGSATHRLADFLGKTRNDAS